MGGKEKGEGIEGKKSLTFCIKQILPILIPFASSSLPYPFFFLPKMLTKHIIRYANDIKNCEEQKGK